jgi:hypothetical protein
MADPEGTTALIVRKHTPAKIPILPARREAGLSLVFVNTLILPLRTGLVHEALLGKACHPG